MRALGRPQDMFSDKAIQLQPIFLHSGFKIFILFLEQLLQML
jgi:hypothetical protein